MSLPDIRDLSFSQMEDFLKTIGEPSFRAQQIFVWLYQKGVDDFQAMTNLPPGLRAKLADRFVIQKPEIADRRVSSDGTQKFLFVFPDGVKIETVLIPAAGRVTVCLSSQAGCKFACRFCASGIGGWHRDLTSAEMISQVLGARQFADGKNISHVVFMGTGEPLDNYDEVLKAVRLLNAQEGFGIGARRITVSTCGLIPGMKRLADEKLQVELSISLHGYNDQVRNQLMPVNRKYPLKELIPACRDYVRRTGRQITFEYILIQDVTCTPEAARALKSLLKGLLCKLNLIPYNVVPEHRFKSPSGAEIREFKKRLSQNGMMATVRSSRGEDSTAACGQLRASY